MNLPPDTIVLVRCELFTAFGFGIDPTWSAILEGRHGFTPITRFHSDALASCSAATASELDGCNAPSEYLLDRFAPAARDFSGERTELFVGTTVGEIEQLDNPEHRCTSDSLMEKASRRFGIPSARVLSAACATANMEICRAAAMLRARKTDFAVLYAVDYVNEFVASGFLTLKAMTTEPCSRPYDKNRTGLLLGDGAGLLVLTRAELAEQHKLPVLAKISGCAMTCDAGHITAPLEDGSQLAAAIRCALAQAGLAPEKIGALAGHGTGTVYNDNMELRALHSIFHTPVPLFSTKGAVGHSLAAAGMVQTAMALRVLQTGKIPPQTSLQTPENGAEGFVSDQVRSFDGGAVLSLSAGFGGLNAAVLLEGVAQ